MKKTIYFLTSILLIASVFAVNVPKESDLLPLMAVGQPVAPGTGTQGECEPWEVANEYCNGDIRHWDLCQKTASGGHWTPHSEDCTDYGSNIVCFAGKCQKEEEISKSIFYVIATIVLIIFIWKYKKGKGKLFLMFLMSVFLLPFASAVDVLLEPYSGSFTPESEIGKSLTTIKSELGVKSCYVKSNWESKECDYLYYCFAILPSTSDSILDALLKECVDVSDETSVILKINQFVPPKGVLYYVTTFITNVHYTYNDAMEKWEAEAEIPTEYINAHSIRSVCPEGQMLDFDMVAGEWKCYISKRACLNTMDTGLCTNVYTLWVLDKNEDGTITDIELTDGSNYCADRPTDLHPEGDRICDMVRDLEAVDVCSKFNIDGVCTIPGPNNLPDEWDLAVNYGCWDDPLSANSKICDTLDVVGCFRDYDPVCIGGRDGTTYPNSCFARGQGYTSSDWTEGSCEPSIVQCYIQEDCPDLQVCLGGSTAGISKMCLDHMCSYVGACGNLACSSDADCEMMEMPCVGVFPQCSSGVCTISGKCLTMPIAKEYNLWDLIAQIWNNFWNWVKNLFV